ncbi:LAFE_0H10066g1_1 [Lachancea fermentati]|uniref:DNA mismatch repair protein n=1 Tax=Lachancea fermentati TaxID=4955 RepID=A0A1G4MKB8_LACFM|nr:LAFE_0H10066g1_1 [Lachancea fermentati]
MMAPATPKALKKIGVKASPQSSGKKKLKQATLLSFFGKQSKSNASTPAKKEGNRSLFVEAEDTFDNDSGFVTAIDEASTIMEPPAKSCSPLTDVSTLTKPSEKKPDTSIVIAESILNSDIHDEELRNSSSGSGTPSKRSKRSVSYAEDSDDDEKLDISSSKKKKRRVLDSDDEEDYVPEDQGESDEDEEEADVEAPSAKDELNEDAASASNDDDDDDDDILKLSADKPRTVSPSKTYTKSSTSGSRIATTKKASPRNRSPSHNSKSKHSNFNKENEERYQWLIHERDAQGRSTDDPEYDARTLYIPSSAWSKFTPFEKQYWEIKSKMWDCIVFFKKGKFFELYEKDAMLANHLFDLKIAGGGRANMQLAGIPEMSFDYWATQFIQHGYKVAKVDQRESMLAKEMREGNKGIVQRELQYVLTSGTLTDSGMLQTDLATFCLAIREEPGNYYDLENGVNSSQTDGKIFGISFIDTATGEIEILELIDDNECTKLETLMSQVKPKEIVMEKNNLCSLAHKIVKFNAQPQAIFNYLRPLEEFYDFDKTFDVLTSQTNGYFSDMDHWPEVLTKYYEQGNTVGFSAFGGLVSYLKWLKLDESMVSMGNIKEYSPIKSQVSLVLDGATLQNLEIFSNSFDGTDRGTLFKLVNKAITPMGKRMMKKWVMHPLLHKPDIEKRLDSVDQMLSTYDLREILENYFSGLPDLERLLARIHSGNLKIKDFSKVIEGFESIIKLLEKLENFDLVGSLASFLSQIPTDLKEHVKNWATAFDRKRASVEDIIIPHPGVEPEFDESLQSIKDLEKVLSDLLLGYKKEFRCANIQYKDSGKEIYTIEVPMAVTKSIPSDWTQMGANKSTKRYYSPEVAKLARSMAEAREMHKILEESLKSRLYKKFDSHYGTVWMPTIVSLSNMDCVLSLARTSESLGFPCCRPKFVDERDPTTGNKLNGHVKFKQLRHPCFNLGATSTKEFIPNDITLGGSTPQIGLLTGANAAGKSTVLRMTCIAVIMAQLGCYVPAESAELSPVDRIMTRLGANDNIMQGKSTFFVELSETKKILDMATNRSLLVLDELGRGGSSSDGFAIAESVLYHVATHIQSLGFFATHYGALGLSFRSHPKVRPMKMNILVDEGSRNITFLYKLVDGQSEGSFGMHVASMCGISKDIVSNAQKAADNLEHTSMLIKKRQQADSGMDEKKMIPLGLQSDFVRFIKGDGLTNTSLGTGEGVMIYDKNIKAQVIRSLLSLIDGLE